MAKTWDWIKKHGAMVIAIGAGLVVAFYLFFRPSGGTPVASTVSFPASGGGGGGSTGGGAPPPAPSTPTLPYSPDFSVLQAITDAALRALYEKEYNLETQINQATLQGNTALVNSLTSALSNIQDQISSYQPPTPTAQPSPSPIPAGRTPYSLPSLDWNAINAAWVAAINNGKASLADYEKIFSTYGVPNEIAQAIYTQSHQLKSTTGLNPTNAQLQQIAQQATDAYNKSKAAA